ncbi:hypothetical protein ROLI_013130 [Roseobacter fucihabitans]|uniref:Aminoglycoside phosphotransferase domain-containing protein n=1 Tax=Roseobacter fucihabitans TaxID=1537242 RepID=A0ABZ2BTN4_9RHOB|nr:hypothetical protein [Roseobacter litoralis]MBC6968120.1 hypothetical protein [Roseobacter litoralis]
MGMARSTTEWICSPMYLTVFIKKYVRLTMQLSIQVHEKAHAGKTFWAILLALHASNVVQRCSEGETEFSERLGERLSFNFMKHHPVYFSKSNTRTDRKEIDQLLRDWSVPDVDDRALASNFAGVMSALLNFDKGQDYKDRPAQIAILLSLWEAAEKYPSLANASFESSHLSMHRSKLELRMRLASRMFFYGRRQLFSHSNEKDAKSCFERAIELFLIDDVDLESLKDFQRSKLLGMRGTTKLFLGRLEAPSIARWTDAYDDLWKSFELGNTGKEAIKSLRELALKVLDLEKTDDWFGRFEKASSLTKEKDHQFHSDTAMYHQYRAMFCIENQQIDDAVSSCKSGVESCNLALSLSAPPPDQAFSRSTRAFLRLVILQQSADVAEDAELEELNAIIDDLRFSYDFKLGGASLPLALLRRSFLLKKVEKDKEAMADLSECLERLELIASDEQRNTICDNATASIADIKIRKAAAASDLAILVELSRELIALGESSWFYLFTVAVSLSNALKENATHSKEDRSSAKLLLNELSNEFRTAVSTTDDENLAQSLSLAISYAANSSRLLDEAGISDETVRLYELAFSLGRNESLEFEAFAGNISLQYAKQIASQGRDQLAAAHFNDAVQRFEGAIARVEAGEEYDEDALKLVVVYSKLGEACLRLAKSGDRDLGLYRKALGCFETARGLGNETNELLGLIGDVYYRLGFWGNDVEALQNALRMKEDAAAAGGKSRENSSVTARIREALYVRTNKQQELKRSVESTLDAISIDRSWPWPFFQLAEIISRHDKAHSFFMEVASLRLPPEFEKLKELGTEELVQGLRFKGVETVLDNTEFKKKVLGGRSKVFVLQDPHRLISNSIVLKPTKKVDAEREIGLTNRVSQSLQDLGEDSRYGVPAPIGLVDVNESDCIYAMRRELGATLADEVLGPSGTGYPENIETLRATVRFLGLFHRNITPTKGGTVSSGRLAKELNDRLKRSSRGSVLSEASRASIGHCLPNEVLGVAKKDGHAENWIVGPYGKVVVIDLEATQSSAVLLDLAQLIEDFPSLRVTDKGWKERMELVDLYWSALGSADTKPGYVCELYELHALQRAVWGHGFCRGKFNYVESSTSRIALSSRSAHFEAILKYLSNGGGSGKLSSVALECSKKLGVL